MSDMVKAAGRHNRKYNNVLSPCFLPDSSDYIDQIVIICE